MRRCVPLPIPCPTGGRKDRWFPLETGGIDLARPLDFLFLEALVVFFDGGVGQNDDPVSFL